MVWVSDNIVLRASPSSYRVSAYDNLTDKVLWNQGPWLSFSWNQDWGFYFDDGLEPQAFGTNILLVNRGPGGYGLIKGICALDLLNGNYNWCRPEEFFSTLAIDHQSQLGYAMRSDDVLLTIDLQSGNILGETKFLSSGPSVEPSGFPSGIVSSITVSQNMVVVSFVNGNQTFGVRILPESGFAN